MSELGNEGEIKPDEIDNNSNNETAEDTQKSNDGKTRKVLYWLKSNLKGYLVPTIIATAIVGTWNGCLMREQNELFEDQNSWLKSQTNLVNKQNQLLNQQLLLSEASRRAAQTFLIGDILSDINIELSSKFKTSKKLSAPLVGRIISLSFVMKPYQYLKNGKLISEPLSPERGQLLISILESGIDKDFLSENIFAHSDFSYSDLEGATINKNLASLNLKGTDFTGAIFNNSYIIDSNLSNSNFSYTKLNNVEINDSEVTSADFSYSTMNDFRISNNTMADCTKLNNINIIGELKITDSSLLAASFLNVDPENVYFCGNSMQSILPRSFSVKNDSCPLVTK